MGLVGGWQFSAEVHLGHPGVLRGHNTDAGRSWGCRSWDPAILILRIPFQCLFP